ncbi:MAG: HD domain-containing protein [Armatimonas sp.]
MKTLPLRAQIYIVCIWILGCASLGISALAQVHLDHFDLWEWVLLLPLSAMLGRQKIHIAGRRGEGDASTMTLSFVGVIACLLWMGPLGGTCAAFIGCLSACLARREQPLYQVAFNVSLSVIEAGCCALAFHGINGDFFHLAFPQALFGTVGITAAMFLTSALGVGIVVALVTGRPLWQQVRGFFWAAPSYLAGASVCMVATLLFHSGTSTVSVGGLIVFLAPVVFFVYQAFRIYVSREEEKRRRIEQLQESQKKLSELYLATIRSLALAIDAKDQYTHQHILRVQRYSLAIARELGIDGDELLGLETGALLHDIGKLGVPEYILLKPGKLTPDEFAQIKKHPEIGAAILDPVPFPWPVLPVVKYHHEKWDGTGYPEGLAGEEIPLTARILAVADVYDALTSSRSYRSAWSHERALTVIREGVGTHFDPALVDAFLKVIDGVVEEMATEGIGPLAKPQGTSSPLSPEAMAARDIRRTSTDLWTMYEMSQTFTGVSGEKDTLEKLVRRLEEIFPGAAYVVLLADPEGRLTTRTAMGYNQEFFARAQANKGGNSVKALTESQSYRGDYNLDDLLVHAASAPWTELRSALIVPLVYGEKHLGTLNLYHPQENAFSEDDEELMGRIAARVAQALANGELEENAIERTLEENVQEYCRPGMSFALVRIALDGLEGIESTFGPERAATAREAARAVLRSTIRATDTIFRGDEGELVVLLLGVRSEEARQSAERVVSQLNLLDLGLLPLGGKPFRFELRLGVASFPQDGADASALLQIASPPVSISRLREAA